MGVLFENTSTAADSITDVYWDFYDGVMSIQYTNVPHTYAIPVPNQITYLFIQTASGCQSVFVDTIQTGTNCDTLTGITTPSNNSNAILKINPTIIHSIATVKTNLKGEQITIDIYDLTGKHIQQIELNHERTFDRNQLKQGIYIYKATIDKKIITTGKLICD